MSWFTWEVPLASSGWPSTFGNTERTWTLVTISDSIKELMKTYVQYPPRKLQSASYTGPVTISNYEKFQWIRDQLGKEGVNLPLPTGN